MTGLSEFTRRGKNKGLTGAKDTWALIYVCSMYERAQRSKKQKSKEKQAVSWEQHCLVYIVNTIQQIDPTLLSSADIQLLSTSYTHSFSKHCLLTSEGNAVKKRKKGGGD